MRSELAGHEVIIHDEAVADVGADGGLKLITFTKVGANGGVVVFVHAQPYGLQLLGGSGLMDPAKGMGADAVAVVFGKEVEFVEESGGVRGIGFPGEVADVGLVAADDGVVDAAFSHFLAKDVGLIHGVEHVANLLHADDGWIDDGPDSIGEEGDARELVGSDEFEVDGRGICRDELGWLLDPGKRIEPSGGVIVGAEEAQILFDVCTTGFDDAFFADLFFVTGEFGFGKDFTGEIPAGPGAPGAQGFVGFDHAGGEMLVVPTRVADEGVIGTMGEDPSNGLIRLPGVSQRNFGKVAGEGAIDEKESLGRELTQPEGLGVVKGGVVKFFAAVFTEGLDVLYRVGTVG